MKISIVYSDGLKGIHSHDLKYTPGDEEEGQNLARRIAMEGFFISEPDIGVYIPPSQVVKILFKKYGRGVVGGQGMSS